MSDENKRLQPAQSDRKAEEATNVQPVHTRVLDIDVISNQTKLDADAMDNARGKSLSRLADEVRQSTEQTNIATGLSKDIRQFALKMQVQQDIQNESLRPYRELRDQLINEIDRYREMVELARQPTLELRHLTAEINRYRDNANLAAGVIEELRQANVFSHGATISAEIDRLKVSVADHEARFRLPDHTQVALLIAEDQRSRIADSINWFRADSLRNQRAMEMMRFPWLDTMNTAQSVAGFAELQGIGQTLRAFSPFDERLADALRPNLGDWRKEIEWPPTIATDAVARSQFYVDRGFNPALTDFPSSAFDESMYIAGLKTDRPQKGKDYETSDEDQGNQEELNRASEAHHVLFRFERRVRSFIDKRMSAACGPDWVKQRVPMYKMWVQKKQKALDKGEPDIPLIEYADFADYVKIIKRNDNWKEVFEVVFRRKEDVQESFYRLFPIRLATMHARFITLDDELFLRAEVRRIQRAIKV